MKVNIVKSGLEWRQELIIELNYIENIYLFIYSHLDLALIGKNGIFTENIDLPVT